MRILICDDDDLTIKQIRKYCQFFFDKIEAKCPELVCFSDGETLLSDEGEKDIHSNETTWEILRVKMVQ